MSWITMGMGWANERRRYIVTPSLFGRAHTQNDPWYADMWKSPIFKIWYCAHKSLNCHCHTCGEPKLGHPCNCRYLGTFCHLTLLGILWTIYFDVFSILLSRFWYELWLTKWRICLRTPKTSPGLLLTCQQTVKSLGTCYWCHSDLSMNK